MTKTLGFQPKLRSKEEIDKEYTFHAAKYGNLMQLAEIHMKCMHKLNEEHSRLPAAEQKLDLTKEDA